MRLSFAFSVFFSIHVLGQGRRAPQRVAVSPHVLKLDVSPVRVPVHPSANYITKRFEPRQIANTTAEGEDLLVAPVQQDILTRGGRVYMTNVTVAGLPYTLVIDTGSSDTWVATSDFLCVSEAGSLVPQSSCNFGRLWDVERSLLYQELPGYQFQVGYTGGEFLQGNLGRTLLELGGIEVEQVVGVVDAGTWFGDSISAGLLGLAYTSLASNSLVLNYTSVSTTLFEDTGIPAVFSLALDRPTPESPMGGGLLAIGGIPDVPYEGDFVSVPIQPFIMRTYAFYSVELDGFCIFPPSSSVSSSRFSRMFGRQQDEIVNDFTNVPVDAIVDSGSTLMYLPDDIADYVAQTFNPPASYNTTSGIYEVFCGAQAPSVSVVIGGRSFWVDALDMIMNEAEGGERATEGYCAIGVQRAGDGDVVLGDTFLRNVVAVFDLAENEMRFAGRVQ